MTVEIGVILPTSTPDPAHPILGDVRESARFAEAAGLDSIWSTDHLVASAPMLDSTVVLAAAAAVTERITVGFNVMLLALRPVAWAAKQVSTLQYVSGNRLVLGIGTGNPAHGDIGWRAAGVSYADRGRRTDEALRVLPDLVTGKRTVLDDGVEVALAPAANMPPVVVAGNGRAALRRAARYGDGWASIGLPPEEIAESLAEIGRLAAELGRPALKATVVGPDVGTDPQQATARLAAYEAAGVERVILAPTGTDWRRDYEFAAKVRSAYN
ncbi:LLM class flavin-dependent oxidoreductase [Amycolatopsis taiwanensis]|uniref:N5,N10-methylene tetrahydromethanopterin reductase n=1 Tax=Amycolatopsis taiwanensis TaxID=342230 RepID=A0A9W6VEI4_9PSEU|nr:LLM class flavin-dependent oxidoreductase [Amycolatopsis taiwanensis]GLY64522.1 N5,N10-methylene tetrahydromethanopterin reductase [Amycolatopsis taiwanensis]